mgnify:CR=1 FL=1
MSHDPRTPHPPHAMTLTEQVYAELRQVFDPEIPVNIVDLGLVYDCQVSEEEDTTRVLVKMTLTAQGCGMGDSIAADAKHKIEGLPGVEGADVQIVWEPPWGPNRMSETAKKKLGIT